MLHVSLASISTSVLTNAVGAVATHILSVIQALGGHGAIIL